MATSQGFNWKKIDDNAEVILSSLREKYPDVWVEYFREEKVLSKINESTFRKLKDVIKDIFPDIAPVYMYLSIRAMRRIVRERYKIELPDE